MNCSRRSQRNKNWMAVFVFARVFCVYLIDVGVGCQWTCWSSSWPPPWAPSTMSYCEIHNLIWKKKKHICRQVANKIKTNRYTWIICINTRVRKRLPSPFPIIVIENRLGQFIFHSIQWLLATEMCSKWNKREREIRFDQVPCWLRDSNHSESFINRLTPLPIHLLRFPLIRPTSGNWRNRMGFLSATPYVFQLQFWVLYKKMKNNWALY